MFTMMNAARLGVGIQGLAVAEAAYGRAAGYARERLQGRALGGAARPDGADPIIVHPDVRRMLLTHAGARSRAAARWRCGSAREIDRGRTARPATQAADDLVALDDADRQGRADRPRRRVHEPRPAGATAATATSARQGVEQLVRDARITHGLRGHERRPGARPRRPQAAGGRRAACCGGSSTPRWRPARRGLRRPAPGRHRRPGARRAAPSAPGDAVDRRARARRSRGGRRARPPTTCASSP